MSEAQKTWTMNSIGLMGGSSPVTDCGLCSIQPVSINLNEHLQTSGTTPETITFCFMSAKNFFFSYCPCSVFSQWDELLLLLIKPLPL